MEEERAERPKPPGDKRLEEIFGRDLGTEDRDTRGEERAREDWYRENRPPHHEGP